MLKPLLTRILTNTTRILTDTSRILTDTSRILSNTTRATIRVTPLVITEWISTLILIIGVYLTAINYYPLNVYISLLGNVGWLIVASIWRKYSLITVQTIIVAVYIAGLYYK